MRLRTTSLTLLAFASVALGQKVEKSEYGTVPEIPNPADKTKPIRPESKVEAYTLTNAAGMTVKILTLGGIVAEWHAPDRHGKTADVVLGFDTIDGYVKDFSYFGCITGRVANRIGNGKFTLEGTEYKVPVNNGKNSIHGGIVGFNKMVWKATSSTGAGYAEVALTYTSPDGEQGYPGKLDCKVRYQLTNDGEFAIQYEATTDKTTIVNLTNHSYFNLAGHDSGTILDHELFIPVANYTPAVNSLPTGKIAPVKGTPFDFNQPAKIGARWKELPDPTGYDVNYAIRTDRFLERPKMVARVIEPKCGRMLEVYTDQPGLQFYTANHFDGKTKGKNGCSYPRSAAFCLETQHFPDSPNVKEFPSITLKPGETYNHYTVYKLAVKK